VKFVSLVLFAKDYGMLKAKDIMTKEVIAVRKDTPIYDAVELLAKHDISGMPVVEDDMTLVGVLSEKDAIVLFYGCDYAEEKTVADYMTQPAIYFDENENLADVSDFLMKNIFRRVPVTSNDKVVGIISVKDILEYILREKRNKASVANGART
jgi:CBS domain-containing protein